MHISWIEFG